MFYNKQVAYFAKGKIFPCVNVVLRAMESSGSDSYEDASEQLGYELHEELLISNVGLFYLQIHLLEKQSDEVIKDLPQYFVVGKVGGIILFWLYCDRKTDLDLAVSIFENSL